MSKHDKEVQAYIETEQWTIDRGLASQSADNSFRKGSGTPIVNDLAIKAHVNHEYPPEISKSGPAMVRGPLPQKNPGDPHMVALTDGSSRPAQDGDLFIALAPRQDLDKKQISPERLTCDPRLIDNPSPEFN
jgi:hypothetical protein